MVKQIESLYMQFYQHSSECDHQWPTIFCSQYKVREWHSRLGSGVIADSIMDRIVHNSITINTGRPICVSSWQRTHYDPLLVS